MKKIILISTMGIFFIPVLVLAIGGACSWHGGVDCAAGPDWDGSVICNDGWRGSSVSYYDMAECQSAPSSRPTCNTIFYSQDEYELNVNSYKQTVGSLQADLVTCLNRTTDAYNNCMVEVEEFKKTLDAMTGGVWSSVEQSMYDNKVNSCSSTKNESDVICHSIYDIYIDTYQNCINNAQVIPLFNCPSNSTYNDITFQCVCNIGYVADGSACITGDNYCKKYYGTYWSYSSILNKCVDNSPKTPEPELQVLGESYEENNPLNLQPGSLVKNLRFAEVFYVDENLCLHWIINEQAALKHFGITWNYEGNIKEFADLGSHGYKFCDTLK